jgi:hypothetical protein
MPKHRKQKTPADRVADAMYLTVLAFGLARMAEVFISYLVRWMRAE